MGGTDVREIRLVERPLIIAVLVAFGLWILLQLVQQAIWVLVMVLVAIILASALMPVVRFVQRLQLPPGGWRIPRAIIVLTVYVLIILVVAGLMFLVGGIILEQARQFTVDLPALLDRLEEMLEEVEDALGLENFIPAEQDLTNQILGFVAGFPDFLLVVVGGIGNLIFQLFIISILALFLVVESDRILNFFVGLFPPLQRAEARRVMTEMGDKVGYWVLGQILVATTVGILAAIVTGLLGIPYWALIGVMTAVLDLMPAVGPSLMVLPVFLLGLTESAVLAVVAAVIFFALAELDAHVLTPLITGRIIQLSRVVILVAVILGLALYGPIGALVAIPTAAALQVVLLEVVIPWLRTRQPEQPEQTEQAS
jgi:predicted PurR-regulated permease PerM